MAAVATPYADLVDLEAIRTEKAERSLVEFVKQAWHVVEPATPYQHNWHIDALCDHLQATLPPIPGYEHIERPASAIRNLLITMPPRAMKSLTVSVFFPAWAWIHFPELRFLFASYAQGLSTEHSQLTRMVIESDWYQDRWGDRYRLSDDDNLKTRFSNTARGYRIATSVGASVTGFGGDYVIVDDPHNVQQAESEAVRSEAVRWWTRAMSTRLNNPNTGVRIVVMQRVHENDVAGAVLQSGEYAHLTLPMGYEPTDAVSPIGWRDPRTQDGELMWPSRYGPRAIAKLKAELGSYAYASQFQQRPAPLEGGILKRHWFGTYDARPPSATTIIQSWDTAFKTGTQHDFSAVTTWAYGPTGAYVLDVHRDRLEFPDLGRAVEHHARRWHPGAILIEDKASGQSLIQHLRATTSLPIIAVPVTRDKIARVNEIAPRVEAGRVFLPVAASWLDEAVHELTTFPLGAHDDITDSVSQALSYIFRIEDGGFRQFDYRNGVDDDTDDLEERWAR